MYLRTLPEGRLIEVTSSFLLSACSDGYNAWRDAKKPSVILSELCKKNGIQAPEYRPAEVKVFNKIFKIPADAIPEGKTHLGTRMDLLEAKTFS